MTIEPFRNIAIVNRGEAAMRLIHAVREYNYEHGLNLKTIALYTEPERQAMFVREADQAVSIGPAKFVDSNGQRKSAYLNYDAIRSALLDSGAEAVWVGWGFVAEHPEFASLCEDELGLPFVGPSAECMRQLGDKITSKRLAEETGVPVAPWSGGPVADVEDAREHAGRIGYPLLIKATAGGGGRGIRVVRDDADLEEELARATSEAGKSFGNATVFMERLVEGARHIEVQIIADGVGSVWAVGVRDCSVQRRNQKLIEESSSPVLSASQETQIKAAAAELCRAAGYRSAGTVEFLYDPRTQSFAFMEVNARLQVEHPVTEASTGLDLVKLQLQVARGGRLDGDPPEASGRAIEVRLNAEDPQKDFAPAPGRIEFLRLPKGPGIRVDTGFEVGDDIPAEFDSMIAKIIASGRDRDEALCRLRRALTELAVVVRGGATNRAFLLELLSLPSVIEGRVDVGWLDREPPSKWSRQCSGGEIALALAAVHEYERSFDIERQLFFASAARGRPKLPEDVGYAVELRHGGNMYRPRVYRYSGNAYHLELDGESLELEVENLNAYERRITCAASSHRTLSICDGVDHLVEVNGIPHRVSRDDGGTIRSPAPAIVVKLKVKPGQRIKRGDTLAILEAMKLEMQLTSPYAGSVRSVDVGENDQVDAGAPLLRLAASKSARADAARVDRLSFASLECVQQQAAPSAEARCREILDELKNMALGYDVVPETSARLIAELDRLGKDLPAAHEERLRQEDLLLTRFVDVMGLARREPAALTDRGGLPSITAPSQQQSMHTYLRALDSRAEGLSRAFVSDLKRALAHYGVTDLEPGRELEEALLWLNKSHARMERQLPVVLSVLARRRHQVGALIDVADDGFRRLLERLIVVSEGCYPEVADLARDVRYQYFDRPVLESTRASAYRQAASDLDALAGHPPATERERLMEALVQCPQPLMTVLSRRFVTGDSATREAILECLTRRYYRVRQLEAVQVVRSEGHPFVTAEYDHDTSRIFLITTHTSYEELTHTGNLALPILARVSESHDIVMDFYVHREGLETGEDDTLTHVRQAIDAVPFPRSIRRIVASVRIPGAGLGMAGQRFMTFRPSNNGYWEETAYRDFHPMMAKRLYLWRFENFKLTRLPSIEDLYLFHAVAREDPTDERLFAVAEVRDLTPFRDERGKVTGLPHLEQMFQEALAGIRLFQSRRPSGKRLLWNRLVLYVWPPMDLSAYQHRTIVYKLFPQTRGLGLEKVVVRGRIARQSDAEPRDTIMTISNPSGRGPILELLEPDDDHRVEPLSSYTRKMLKLRQRGLCHPYEIVKLMAPSAEERSPFPHGRFVEHDLHGEGRLEPVDRPHGGNSANIVVGVITNVTGTHPDGLTRVMILGDPSRGMCPLAEPECSRVIGALDLAERMGVPVEWFAVSAGAKIAMDSGTENLDWTAAVLRRIIEFTQAGGEINLVVHGVNVGAQSYWNAEATMLMHTHGILIMTPQGAMVLTGKEALDHSGGVSAEDNFGIGGYDRIMGPNGLAQYWASDIDEACRILLRYYDHSYTAPGERFPRRIETRDPVDRDVTSHPYESPTPGDFATIGEIFSKQNNPDRKRPFEIRQVMHAVVDQDQEQLERWSSMQHAEIGVVWDAHLGGRPVCVIGIESRPISRPGFVPADGPQQWTAGTLFPCSSRKVARAINSASGSRPLVVLANLSGFDGSPESMRRWQLEYGAEIGRAVVNFDGPIVFCVVSRYHGGAFVVFSKSLNENMEVAALEGSYASVIGGAPAAAVVFGRDVRKMAAADPRVTALGQRLEQAPASDRTRLRAEYDEMLKSVQSEKRKELAREFDAIHTIQRAMEVGSVDRVIPARRLRPYLIDAVERGIARVLGQGGTPEGATSGPTDEHATSALSDSETA